MSGEHTVDEIVTNFLLDTCRLRPLLTDRAVQAAALCAKLVTRHPSDDAEAEYIPLTTGSVAEFYIEPMLPLVGDVDVMFHRSTVLAIPRGHPPPTQLPAEFSDYVKVFEIVDSDFPGYVYLLLRYLRTEFTDDVTYRYTYFTYDPGQYLSFRPGDTETIHGPAMLTNNTPYLSVDAVHCVRCLSWPAQAADWPTRHRNYGWPDSATVDLVVSNGCDVVHVAHRQCRHDEWESKRQWRLSFSRAEIVLLNSWVPVQQIVYHMLRVFVKTELLKDSDSSDSLSNYHIKTLMMWACELKSNTFWTGDLNLIRISVELLHTLSVRLTDTRCKHYFINNCNLMDNYFGVETIASQLKSLSKEWLSSWFINNYIQKCSLLCPGSGSSLFSDISTNTKLQKAVSAVVDWRLNTALVDMWNELSLSEWHITCDVSRHSLNVRSCVCWMTELSKRYTPLTVYFTAVTFLYVAYKISRTGFTDDLMDFLATIAGEFVITRRHRSQCRSELSLSQQPTLSAADLNTSELVELLQRSAVEHMTTYRQLEARDFGSVATIVTTDFEALYAYKHGDYQRCLQLSTQNVHTLLYTVHTSDIDRMPNIATYPEFVQLLDDDIVSLIALTLIVNPKCRVWNLNAVISQLTLSLYLMTQCQLKLRHSVTSLAQTLHYIEVAQIKHPAYGTLDHLTLKLIKRKVLMKVLM